MAVYSLYKQAETFRQTPSEMIGIQDPVIAFQFDRAILLFGRQVDNKLSVKENRGTKKKPRWEQKYTLKTAIREVVRSAQRQPKGVGAQLLDGLQMD